MGTTWSPPREVHANRPRTDPRCGYRGPVPWFKKTPSVAPTGAADASHAADSPEVEPLTDAEVDWVRSTIAELIEQDVRVGDIDDLGRHYDELLSAWLRLREADRPDPDRIISQIGIAFGQYVADHAGLSWGVATGQTGPRSPCTGPVARVRSWYTPRTRSPSAGAPPRPGSSPRSLEPPSTRSEACPDDRPGRG